MGYVLGKKERRKERNQRLSNGPVWGGGSDLERGYGDMLP